MPPDFKNQKRTPYAALLWSAMLPGFGQMYNRDFIVGAVLIILEFGTNILAKLNYAIIHSFNLSPQVNELTDANFQWMLFYPGIWSYSMWQAYNKAREINSVTEKGGAVTTKFTGLFVGLTVFMQLGVIWPLLHSPILTGIIFGSFGAVIGDFCEKYWTAGRSGQQFNGELRQETQYPLYFFPIFAGSPDAILLTAPDGKIFDANPAACDLFGMSHKELLRSGRGGVVDPGVSYFQSVLEKSRQNGVAAAELRFIRKDQTQFLGEVVSSLLRTKTGKVYLSIIIRDSGSAVDQAREGP
ncbi:PAS domain-containing protein|uniref:PAS domain S-box-containing protein n=1 Tax=Dendrosporobacter quercicolus TaxID=146817 RepID=A0A1G9SG77_9FIRM|nr:PAS domain-containing protein [Dendrosporobacter quercicolus]NSL48727.1 PAS domain-containing protein [Dendrosporobacter quercicolus DSM 1736]SDM34488.1 PAS domain S-box-containing protein [Dendrosporobacter quercicolus]